MLTLNILTFHRAMFEYMGYHLGFFQWSHVQYVSPFLQTTPSTKFREQASTVPCHSTVPSKEPCSTCISYQIQNNDWQMKWSAKHLYMVHEGSADQCQFPGSSPRSRDFSIKKKCWPKKPTERFGPQNTACFSSHFTCGDGHLLLVPSSLAENEGNPRSGSPGCWSSAEHKRSQSKHPVLPVRVWRNISTNKKLTGIQFPKLGQHAASDSSSATGSVGLAKRGTASQVKRWSYIFKNSFFAFHFWKKILPNSKKVDL